MKKTLFHQYGVLKLLGGLEKKKVPEEKIIRIEDKENIV